MFSTAVRTTKTEKRQSQVIWWPLNPSGSRRLKNTGTLLGLQSRLGEKPLELCAACPQTGTALLSESKSGLLALEYQRNTINTCEAMYKPRYAASR